MHDLVRHSRLQGDHTHTRGRSDRRPFAAVTTRRRPRSVRQAIDGTGGAYGVRGDRYRRGHVLRVPRAGGAGTVTSLPQAADRY